jgi:hypothetical protein
LFSFFCDLNGSVHLARILRTFWAVKALVCERAASVFFRWRGALGAALASIGSDGVPRAAAKAAAGRALTERGGSGAPAGRRV